LDVGLGGADLHSGRVHLGVTLSISVDDAVLEAQTHRQVNYMHKNKIQIISIESSRLIVTEGEGEVSPAGGSEENETPLIGVGGLDAQLGHTQGQLQGAELVRARLVVLTDPAKFS
jgi:hypothetical protein